MNLPAMVKIRQRFDNVPLADIDKTIADEFTRNKVSTKILPGQRVAVTAGSRGINNIAHITRTVVNELKNIGAEPFIVPAMGSHGGATDEGQAGLLNHLGISEETIGAPIISSMETVSVGETDDGIPVYIDKNAHGADHIIVLNRIKPHTDFVGVNESGLVKMLAIGLGKQSAADLYHCLSVEHGHFKIVSSAAKKILDTYPITFGIGIVEDQKDDTAIIEMIPQDRIVAREQELLVKAKEFFPIIPFAEFDVLIVDEMGKTYSGTGMDQKVIGRTVVPYHVVPDVPKILRIFVRHITEESEGNATGLGNADFTTTRLVNRVDKQYSYMNTITASSPELIRIPPHFDRDEDCLEACVMTLPFKAKNSPRIVRIKNTLHLETLYVSENMLVEVENNSTLEIVSEPVPLTFDEDGNITDSVA